MAYESAVTAIREALDDGHGSLRTIVTSRFDDTLHEGTAEHELQRRGVHSSKPFQVRVTGRRRHPFSPRTAGGSSLLMREVTFEVVVSRTIDTGTQLDADLMSALHAAALEDADAIEQALGTPPNLATTAGGASTSIVGDCARYEGFRRPSVVAGNSRQPGSAQRLEVAHRLSMILQAE